MELLAEILSNLREAFLGGAGGLVAYLYHFAQSREKDKAVRMDWVAFFVHGIVGAFMSYSCSGIVPPDLSYRDGILCIVGVVGFGLMGAIESKLVGEILSKFKF